MTDKKQLTKLDDLIFGYDYVGWVPNLSGHIYFSYLQCRSGFCDRLALNFSTPCNNIENAFKRHVFVTTIDDATDWHKDSDHTGHIRYILVASTDPDSSIKNSLSGELYLLFSKNKTNSDIEKDFSKTIFDVKHSSLDIHIQYSRGEMTPKQRQDKQLADLESLKKQTDRIITSNEFYIAKINFEVIKDGFIGLKVDREVSNLENKSLEYEVTDRLAPRVVELAYYFIKFSLHKNYHHHSKHDAATGLLITGLIKDCNISGSNKIKKSIVADVFVGYIRRAIIDARRGSLKNNIDVKGFAAYGKSLIYILEKLDYKGNISDINSMSLFQDSTDAYSKRLGIDERVNNLYSFASIFTKSTVAVFALLTPILQTWLRSATPDYVESRFISITAIYLLVLFVILFASRAYISANLKCIAKESTFINEIKEYFFFYPSLFELDFFELNNKKDINKIIKDWRSQLYKHDSFRLFYYTNIATLIWRSNNNISKPRKFWHIIRILACDFFISCRRH